MKNIIIPFLLGLIIILPSGCEDWGTNNKNRSVTGDGPIVTKILTLDEFNKIENIGVADIYVSLGSPQSVVLKAQQNIIDEMIIGVAGGELKIGLREDVSIQEADTIRFNITVPEITSVNLIGVGDFVLSGDYQEELAINLTGVGTVKAFDLEVGTCNIFLTGVGDCEVNVRNELVVEIIGVGDIYYRGQPDITQSISGVGRLINAN